MTDLAARMAELGARFAGRAEGEANEITALMTADDRAGLAERAHKLAGTAGMFGHPQVGAAALALETAAESGADYRACGAALIGLLGALAAGSSASR